MAVQDARGLALYHALLESRFSRAMNWVVAALGVAYAAWCVAADWPAPGPWDWVACLAAAAGVALAPFDVHAWVRLRLGRLLLRRVVRRRA